MYVLTSSAFRLCAVNFETPCCPVFFACSIKESPRCHALPSQLVSAGEGRLARE